MKTPDFELLKQNIKKEYFVEICAFWINAMELAGENEKAQELKQLMES
tara:strand:- start:430 stop:573 length:144 start_codon:yes stop_codon:yes gene_type:complete